MKARTNVIQSTARQLLEAHGWQTDQQVPYRDLAPALMARAGCSLDTAKRHLVQAGRIMRGEVPAQWGGARDGAGRLRKEERMKRQNYSNQAAEQEGRTRSGQASRERVAIESLSDAELVEAHTWSRFAADWKQALIHTERQRRGI